HFLRPLRLRQQARAAFPKPVAGAMVGRDDRDSMHRLGGFGYRFGRGGRGYRLRVRRAVERRLRRWRRSARGGGQRQRAARPDSAALRGLTMRWRWLFPLPFLLAIAPLAAAAEPAALPQDRPSAAAG